MQAMCTLAITVSFYHHLVWSDGVLSNQTSVTRTEQRHKTIYMLKKHGHGITLTLVRHSECSNEHLPARLHHLTCASLLFRGHHEEL